MFKRNYVKRKVVSVVTALALAINGCMTGQALLDQCTASIARILMGNVSDSGALIALELLACADGDRLRAFLTDGSPDGDTELFEGLIENGVINLVSSSARAKIEGQISADSATGLITLDDGVARAFSAAPAAQGAGIYDVSVSSDGKWLGTGAGGSKLIAQQNGTLVTGALTDSNGQLFPYQLHDLSRVFEESRSGGAADRYHLLVGPRGDVQLGLADTAARNARENGTANFVRLDLPASKPTPGTFFGMFQDVPDLISLEVEPTSDPGTRHVRVYIADGAPAPDGHAWWFQLDFTGNSFDATSTSGNVQLAATITPEGVVGTATFPDGATHRYFAPPAGEGAGIYEVKLSPGRMSGTSIKGGSLDLQIVDGVATGTLTAPDGQVITYSALDLGAAFSDPEMLAQVPDTFVLMAAPKGRFLVGSPGNVQGLVVIAIIAVLIGLLLPAVQKVRPA